MTKVMYIFLLWPGFVFASAVKIGDKIDVLDKMIVCTGTETNCEAFRKQKVVPFKKTCAIGLEASAEVLKIIPDGNSNLVLLNYFPGNGRWEDERFKQCGNITFYMNIKKVESWKRNINNIQKLKVEAVKKSELLGYHNNFSKKNVGSLFAGQIINWGTSFRGRTLLQKKWFDFSERLLLSASSCILMPGHRLKILGFSEDSEWVLVKVIDPKGNERMLPKTYAPYCLEGSIFDYHTTWLLRGALALYEKNLRLRKTLLKAVINDALGKNVFDDLPMTKDGFAVGQEVDILAIDSGGIIAILNIDESFIHWQEGLLTNEKKIKKRIYIEDIMTRLLFTNETMDELYWKENKKKLILALRESPHGNNLASRIIGFVKSPFWEENRWLAIVENEIVGHPHAFFEFPGFKFVLIPTSQLNKIYDN